MRSAVIRLLNGKAQKLISRKNTEKLISHPSFTAQPGENKGKRKVYIPCKQHSLHKTNRKQNIDFTGEIAYQTS